MENNITAVILCGGEATRWNDYLGVKKHLIEIEGERLLDRTTRLLHEKGIKDIYAVVKDANDQYKTPYSKLHIIKPDYEKNADADKFLSSKELWSKTGRTIVFYGDCYFTEEAIDTIVEFNKREWTLFCRPNASTVTGTKWGECFAQSFYSEHLEEHEIKLHKIAEKKRKGEIRRCGGWEHYRAMTGQIDLNKHVMTTNYVEIDDWTEDFDFADDLIEWQKRRKAYLQTLTN